VAGRKEDRGALGASGDTVEVTKELRGTTTPNDARGSTTLCHAKFRKRKEGGKIYNCREREGKMKGNKTTGCGKRKAPEEKSAK